MPIPLTADQYAVATSWVGDIAKATLDDRYERFQRQGSLPEKAFSQMIEEQLRYELALLLNSPGRLTLPDGTTMNNDTNITEMRNRLKDFRASGMDTANPTSGIHQLSRPSGR